MSKKRIETNPEIKPKKLEEFKLFEVFKIPIIKSALRKSHNNKLSEEEITKAFSALLFEINMRCPEYSLAVIRDKEQIRKTGIFKYSGQSETLTNEGLMPKYICNKLLEYNIDRHIGPSYLKLKGLLTEEKIRKFFGEQLAYFIGDYLNKNPIDKEGFIVIIPNMTGGAWIADETRRQLTKNSSIYKIWPATPYMRAPRELSDLKRSDIKLSDYVEGFLPNPKDTSMIICFEDMVNTAEMSKNAIEFYKRVGYNSSSRVKYLVAAVFDYEHIAAIKRFTDLDAVCVSLVKGRNYFKVAKYQNYITETQYSTAIDWLVDPWNFTKNIMPFIKINRNIKQGD